MIYFQKHTNINAPHAKKKYVRTEVCPDMTCTCGANFCHYCHKLRNENHRCNRNDLMKLSSYQKKSYNCDLNKLIIECDKFLKSNNRDVRKMIVTELKKRDVDISKLKYNDIGASNEYMYANPRIIKPNPEISQKQNILAPRQKIFQTPRRAKFTTTEKRPKYVIA